MDATDASIKRQLLNIQTDLADAYEKGPEELDSFMKTWTNLKDHIIAAASAHLLSVETLQLAAEVAKSVAAIAVSVLEVNAAGAKLGAQLAQQTTAHVLLDLHSQQDSQQSDDEDPDSPPNSEFFPDSEGDDEWEDPRAPKYYVLRDWFLANVGHPFLDPAQDYEELVKQANIDRDEFLKWLEFVRTRSGWERIFRTHARSSVHWMEKLCSQVFDELDRKVPRRKSAVPLIIRDDFRAFGLQVDRIYNLGLSEWWDQVNDMLAVAGYKPWSDPVDDVDWNSEGYFSPNEDIDDSDSDAYSVELGSAMIARSTEAAPNMPMNCPVVSAPASAKVVGTKRKVVDLADEPLASPLFITSSSHESHRKRRKLQHTPTLSQESALHPQTGYFVSSASCPTNSQSSRVSLSPSPPGCSASDLQAPGPQDGLEDPPVGAPQLHVSAVYKSGGSTPSLIQPPSLQEQVQADSVLQAQSIRSSHAKPPTKRKRRADPDESAFSSVESKPLNPQIHGLQKITTFNSRTNRIYSRMHLIDHKGLQKRSSPGPIDTRPRKRLREDRLSPPVQSSELGTASPTSLEKGGCTQMDSSSVAPQVECRHVDFTAAHSVKDEEVVQPLASAPFKQEATSLTTPASPESADITGRLPRDLGYPQKGRGLDPDSHLSVESSSRRSDHHLSPPPWSPSYTEEPPPDGYGSPYDSTPGLNHLSPSDATSISGDVQTPFSLADSNRDSFSHATQA